MAYNIRREKGYDVDYGDDYTKYSICFKFKDQVADVEIYALGKDTGGMRLVSRTDGYNWLQFFLSQVPNTEALEELEYNEQIARCKAIFLPLGIDYVQEDKESAFLRCDGEISDELIEGIAKVIEPRFANRERFFDD